MDGVKEYWLKIYHKTYNLEMEVLGVVTQLNVNVYIIYIYIKKETISNIFNYKGSKTQIMNRHDVLEMI